MKPNEKVSGFVIQNHFELQHHDSLTGGELVQDNIFGQAKEDEKLPTFKSPEWAGSKPKASNFLSKFQNRKQKESNRSCGKIGMPVDIENTPGKGKECSFFTDQISADKINKESLLEKVGGQEKVNEIMEIVIKKYFSEIDLYIAEIEDKRASHPQQPQTSDETEFVCRLESAKLLKVLLQDQKQVFVNVISHSFNIDSEVQDKELFK